MKIKYFSIFTVLSVEIPNQILLNKTPTTTQSNAVKQLIFRTVLDKASYFEVDINSSLEYRSFQVTIQSDILYYPINGKLKHKNIYIRVQL